MANIFKCGLLRLGGELLLKRPAPTLFMMPGLTQNLPIWYCQQDVHSILKSKPPFLQNLEDNYKVIKQEYLKLNETEDLHYNNLDEHKLTQDGSSWKWSPFVMKGKENLDMAKKCPKTFEIISKIPGLMKDTPFGYTFYSNLQKHSKIDPHSGSTNLKLRIHLPLTTNSKEECYLNVAGNKLHYKEGEAFLFDDSFYHEAINDSNEDRIILLIDIFHPDIEIKERDMIKEMFNKTTSPEEI